MDIIAILAEQAQPTDTAAAVSTQVEISKELMNLLWTNITHFGLLEALTFVSFGIVCLFYGWRVFKVPSAIERRETRPSWTRMGFVYGGLCLLEFAVKGFSVKAKDFAGLRSISTHLNQNPPDIFFLHLIDGVFLLNGFLQHILICLIKHGHR